MHTFPYWSPEDSKKRFFAFVVAIFQLILVILTSLVSDLKWMAFFTCS